MSKPARSAWRSAARSWLNVFRGAARGVVSAVASTASAMGWPGGGGYQVLDPNRKIINSLTRMLASYSANELANLSLAQLRSLCRKLERDNATARAAVEGSVADVVGGGIGLEPDTGDETLNARIRPVWLDFLAGCDVTGTRSLSDLQTEAFRSWYCSGEHVWRYVVLPELIDEGRIPLAILPLESEWISNDLPDLTEGQITRVAGMETDKYGRPLAYWLRNPEFLAVAAERVLARDINHGFEHRRPLQNRGEPWLTPVIERIHQEGDLIDTELKAAINCAGIAVVVTSDYHADDDDGTDLNQKTDGTASDPAAGIGVGSVARMYPGDKVEAFMHNRPGQQISPFTQLLRGSIAAACRVASRWLDRDYSRANYSSMRADQQDTQRVLAPVRKVFGHATIGAVYRRVLPYLCAKAGVAVPARKAYKLMFDGVPYVNPRDDIQAICQEVAGGFSTWQEACAKRGKDYRDVWKQLAIERKEAEALGLVLDLSGTNAPAPDSTVGGDAEPKPATTTAKADEQK